MKVVAGRARVSRLPDLPRRLEDWAERHHDAELEARREPLLDREPDAVDAQLELDYRPPHLVLAARKVLGWEFSYKRLKLAQLLGQLGIFLTCAHCIAHAAS